MYHRQPVHDAQCDKQGDQGKVVVPYQHLPIILVVFRFEVTYCYKVGKEMCLRFDNLIHNGQGYFP